MKIRIHHFYDIIRDFGSGKEIKPHLYKHSYHKVAELIKSNPDLKIEIVIGADAVCNGCIHLNNGLCDDIIAYRKDFTSKEKFNNYLDQKILKVCSIKQGESISLAELFEKAQLYLKNIYWIYDGNDLENTKKRKENLIKGIKYLKTIKDY